MDHFILKYIFVGRDKISLLCNLEIRKGTAAAGNRSNIKYY